ncbi:MAG: hypothetical protein PQJ28_01005 [Spirochaetales bacterium]|nr:hypothetical protein [Spirochaetales bacterium]
MKQLHDLETFTNILIEKGYNGYFHTESSYAGKLKDSISAFLEASEKGQDVPLVANKLYLNTYLQWNGEDSPKIECNMWVKFENGYFDLQETEIVIKKNRLLRKSSKAI